MLAILQAIKTYCSISAYRQAIVRILRENKHTDLPAKFQAFRFAMYLSRGQHSSLQQLACRLIQSGKLPHAHYYLAHSQFLLGEYSACLQNINIFLKVDPHHADAVYLQSDCLLALDQRNLAWAVLEDLARNGGRPKTWLIMANLVENRADFDRLLQCFESATSLGLVPAKHKNITEYIVLGALRAKAYDAAKERMRELVFNMAIDNATMKKQQKPFKVNFSSNLAGLALRDLKRILKQADIQFFLVSGTLLGCIREGQLLGHDKDIDVGIWDDVPVEKLLPVVRTSGIFYVQASRSPHVIRIKHVNGTAIDIFYHYREADQYWHGGVKVKWVNSPFNLIEYPFLDDVYLIPENYDKYLTESYSNWQVPQKQFDSAYDTSNAEVINYDEQVIHTYRVLIKQLQMPEASEAIGMLDFLSRHGEAIFVEQYKKLINIKKA